jgi:hypothetical protein
VVGFPALHVGDCGQGSAGQEESEETMTEPTRELTQHRLSRLFIDERVKWKTIGAFKAAVKKMNRQEFESFKHHDVVWLCEEEAVLVPYDIYLEIQAMLAETETHQ